MKKIYIAGKISNNPDAEKQFNEVEEKLQSLGFLTVNPHTAFKDCGLPENLIMIECIKLLDKCDGACFIPNYYDSDGSVIELYYCKKFKKEMYLSVKNYGALMIRKKYDLPIYELEQFKDILYELGIRRNLETEKLLTCRLEEYVELRQMFVRILKSYGFNLMQIGSLLNYHHTTVIHNLECAKHYLLHEKDYLQKYVDLRCEIESILHKENIYLKVG